MHSLFGYGWAITTVLLGRCLLAESVFCRSLNSSRWHLGKAFADGGHRCLKQTPNRGEIPASILQGFSKIQGICHKFSSSIRRKQVLKHLFPTETESLSFSLKKRCGIHHGKRTLLITFVRSRAREKLVQMGAIITASTLPLRMSRTNLCTIASVRSCEGPWIISHCLLL